MIDGVMEMPKAYAAEMVADWLGSSYVYTGSWDMEEWLNKNFYSGKIILHHNTKKFVETLLILIRKADTFKDVKVEVER